LKLSERQERFCREYAATGNGSKAALAAGYSQRGPNATAARLLANASIRARVADIQRPRFDALDLTGERTLAEVSRIAFATDAEVQSGAVRIPDKLRALDILCRAQGLYVQDKAGDCTAVQIIINKP
jgi:phage terminase small subunit